MTSFDLTLKTGGSLHPDGEPDDFISDIRGVIHAEGDDGVPECVGRVRAYRINSGLAASSGEPLFDVCDAHSQELHEIHTLLYEPGQYGFKDPLVERFDAMEFDCLLVDHVVLHPKWRGLRLGLLALRKLVDLVGGGCGLVVSDIAPLKPDAHEAMRVPRSWIPRHRTREERKQAVLKLRRYFRQMGFERIGRSPYYGLSTVQQVPTLADLIRAAPPEHR